MDYDLQLMTPTGDRPKAWEICQKYIERQTFSGKVIWHVTDDGKEESTINFNKFGYELVYHRLTHLDENTQARNMQHMLPYIDSRIPLAIIEDDDWYSCQWLQVVMDNIHKAPLIGEINARYYNVATHMYREFMNKTHSSLCSTAMVGEAINSFRDACDRKSTYIDMDLWREFKNKYLLKTHHVIGLKGVGGRAGIGIGHRAFDGKHDPDSMKLKEWIGDDIRLY
jgi:hypothetical protein